MARVKSLSKDTVVKYDNTHIVLFCITNKQSFILGNEETKELRDILNSIEGL